MWKNFKLIDLILISLLAISLSITIMSVKILLFYTAYMIIGQNSCFAQSGCPNGGNGGIF